MSRAFGRWWVILDVPRRAPSEWHPQARRTKWGAKQQPDSLLWAARWFRSLVLALSKCLVAAAPKIRPVMPVVSIAPAGCVAGPADCKMPDWLPHFLRRERSNGRVAMQTQLDLQLNLPLFCGMRVN